jgi:hypothetical protein
VIDVKREINKMNEYIGKGELFVWDGKNSRSDEI